MADLAWLALISLVIFPVILVLLLWLIRAPARVQIPIKGRHVFITGGSSGIGLELAKLAATQGARISILARDRKRLDEAESYISKHSSHEVKTFSADVADYEAVVRTMEAAEEIDVLICSHGLAVVRSLEDISIKDVNTMLDTNLKGNINIIKAAISKMKQPHDNPRSIAIVSSQAGQTGVFGLAAYSATKFGLRGLAEVLQQELFFYNIRVSLIFPPDTYTPGFIEENKGKPDITKELSSTSTAMEAIVVAKKTLSGIKAGHFFVACNFDGLVLNLATAGVSPQPSLRLAIAEVLLAGFMRIISLCLLWSWYRKISSWYSKKK
ncbi:hypothetical protein O6H91_09G078300 [Diphasiastrum complanatum]|uniref:Uncharacterized protein n=1 Tax=Diphasiastrum complanatum TaxID=34168 RepID=A0ACC2CQY4_DIPCM|nr:hypothetical protein O6H91_09G078300 [Diphasiastrum complanatum]